MSEPDYYRLDADELDELRFRKFCKIVEIHGISLSAGSITKRQYEKAVRLKRDIERINFVIGCILEDA